MSANTMFKIQLLDGRVVYVVMEEDVDGSDRTYSDDARRLEMMRVAALRRRVSK